MEVLQDWDDVMSTYMDYTPGVGLPVQQKALPKPQQRQNSGKRKLSADGQSSNTQKSHKKSKMNSVDSKESMSSSEYSAQPRGNVFSRDTSETKLCCTASSLMDICIDFVAANITLVESFVGFPDDIELDLSFCKLGDDHDMLIHLSNLPGLLTLGLTDNALSDDGIQRLTTPLRILGKGPGSLTKLYLSGNGKITKKSVRYLKCYKNLLFLDLSGTSISEKNYQFLNENLKMRLERNQDKSEFPLCQCQGWAADVVESWKNKPKEISEASRHGSKPQSAISKFYGKKKPVPLESSTLITDFVPRIVLVRDSSVNSRNESRGSERQDKQNSVPKDKLSVEYGRTLSAHSRNPAAEGRSFKMKSIVGNQLKNKDSSLPEDAMDDDFQSLLSTYSVGKKTKNTSSSLWDAMGSW